MEKHDTEQGVEEGLIEMKIRKVRTKGGNEQREKSGWGRVGLRSDCCGAGRRLGFLGGIAGKGRTCQWRRPDVRVCSLRSRRCPGGGCGNPHQCSCLKNPMDRGACQATVHSVTQNRHDESHLTHTFIFLHLKSLSRVRLFATPWTIQSVEFSKPEYWSG